MSRMLTTSLLAACVAALFCFTPAVATAQGGGAGPGPGAGQAATTLTTFETLDFSGSGVCAICHSRLTDQEPKDVSNDAHWRSTMMANAAKDPFWQAKISSEGERASHLQSSIEEKCSRCHMGMARYQAITDGTPVGVLGAGFLDPAHYLHEAAMDGVSCALCHQVQPTDLGTPSSYTGKYVIDTSTSLPNRVIFGPYQNPLRNAMRQAAGFDPAFGAQIEDSAHCGSCHTLYTPTLNADGNIVGEFPEQTTYLEWEHSGLTESCQSCHLPQALGWVVISNRPPRLAARTPFWQHHFVGGNAFMLDMLNEHREDLDVLAEPEQLTRMAAATRQQLVDSPARYATTSRYPIAWAAVRESPGPPRSPSTSSTSPAVRIAATRASILPARTARGSQSPVRRTGKAVSPNAATPAPNDEKSSPVSSITSSARTIRRAL